MVSSNSEQPTEGESLLPLSSSDEAELDLSTGESEEASTVPTRSEHLRDLAFILFDQTRPLHELDEMSRQVLGLAAELTERSVKLGKKQPLKAVRKMLKAEYGEDLTEQGEALLAPVIALQMGRIRPKDILRMDLPTPEQRAILTLAALLKIAVGLDASDSQSTRIEKLVPSREETWIVIDGANAELDAAAAEQQARLWAKIGYPKITVLQQAEARQNIALYPPEYEPVSIEASDSLAEAGRKVMLQQFQAMLSQEQGTRLGEDIEALHDMRVATRRLRAAFEVFADAFDPKQLKKHLKGLRSTGRALGQVRDLDVFREKAQKYLEEHPEEGLGVEPLLQSWQAQREKARLEMLAYLDSKEYLYFKEAFNVFIHTPGAGVISLPGSGPLPTRVCELAPILIYERMASVRAYQAVLPGAPIEQLHALRIEFKKLRYTVEYFKDVLGVLSKDLISEFKGMQDHLGDLVDAQVAIRILEEFLAEEKEKGLVPEEAFQAEAEAVHAYLAYRQAELNHLLETFPEAWENFNRPEFRKNLAEAVSEL